MPAPEERTGSILSVSSDLESGQLRDSESGEEGEFKNPALVDIKVTDEVIYVRIETGNNKRVNIIRDKK